MGLTKVIHNLVIPIISSPVVSLTWDSQKCESQNSILDLFLFSHFLGIYNLLTFSRASGQNRGSSYVLYCYSYHLIVSIRTVPAQLVIAEQRRQALQILLFDHRWIPKLSSVGYFIPIYDMTQVQVQQPESKWIEANGVRLHYADWGGSGKQPLLLVHGLQDCCRLWDFFARQVSDRYHVIALDHRGHGDSAWAESYGLEDYVREIEAVIEGLDLRNLVLMGHSAGAKNSFILASRQPHRLARLIIYDMDPDAYNPSSALMFDRYKTETDEYDALANVVERLRTRQPGSSEEVLQHSATHMTKSANGGLVWKRDRDLVLKYERPDAWGHLSHIAVPTLIVRGAESTLLNADVATRMQQRIPGSRLVEIPGGGHWAYLEQPEAFLEVVSNFLDEKK
jgi:pimeloyl-ACP methyl ester carboxylesterase